MYKIDLHVHTKYISACGHLDAAEIVDGYIAAGYDAIVITDHFKRFTYKWLGLDPADTSIDRLGEYLRGYELVRAEGEKKGLHVIRGAEITFDENSNDYLLFGWHEELLADPDAVFRMGLEAFCPLARADGALLIQAHPYREVCRPADPAFLEGMEILNAHPRHDDHNDLAKAYAERYGLIPTAGSDCHQPPDIGRAGIYCETMPADTFELAGLIRSGAYEIFGTE